MTPGQIGEVTKDDAEGVKQNREGRVSAKRNLETGAIWEMTRKKMDRDKFTDNSKVAPLASQQRNDKLSLFFPVRRGEVKGYMGSNLCYGRMSIGFFVRRISLYECLDATYFLVKEHTYSNNGTMVLQVALVRRRM